MALTAGVFRLSLILTASMIYLGVGRAQRISGENIAHSTAASFASCESTVAPLPVREALSSACLRTHVLDETILARNVIVVGFVGGFAKDDDLNHPEVNFAAMLNDSYPSTLHAEVFANHKGNKALQRVLRLVDSDENGLITADEKEKASVIIYGHSWGGSQTVTLARALGQYGIPVQLTIQVDSVRKPGQEDSTIPPNVKNAVNFYQTRGPIHGRPLIRAADPEKTNILGNHEMTYRNRRINCANYPWVPRHFNKPHHEIENDPKLWEQVASLIDSELANPAEILQPPSIPSK
jgi:hypothetical protein